MINNNNKRKLSNKIDILVYFFFMLLFFLAFDIGIFHHSIMIAEYMAIGGFITSSILIKFKKDKLPESKYLPYEFLMEMLLLLIFYFIYINISNISLYLFIIAYSLIYSILVIIIYILIIKFKHTIFNRSNFLYNLDKNNKSCNYLMNDYNIIIKIYTLRNTKITATAIARNNYLNVYINNQIYNKLNDNELSLLILHEFAHIKYKHTQKRFIFYAIPIFLFFLMVSLYIFGYKYPYQFYSILASFSYFAIAMLIYNKIKLYNEIQADKFAIKITNDKEDMISLLNKLCNIVLINADENINKKATIKFKNKRIAKLEAYKI